MHRGKDLRPYTPSTSTSTKLNTKKLRRGASYVITCDRKHFYGLEMADMTEMTANENNVLTNDRDEFEASIFKTKAEARPFRNQGYDFLSSSCSRGRGQLEDPIP